MAWLTEVSEEAATELRAVIAATTRPAEAGCLEWLGEVKVGKYAAYGRVRFWDDGKKRLTGAHRASYLAHKGAIGPGLTVHHECYNTLCVNPAHLSLLTMGDNLRDGNPGRKRLTPKFQLGDRVECRNGHPWIEGNVGWDKRGYSHCKVCMSKRFREFQRRKALTRT